MRAAVVEVYGQPPSIREYDEPVESEGQEVVEIELAGINPIDLAIASGTFDAGAPPLPYVPGREGIAVNGDGERIWFDSPMFPFGSMAEKAPIAAGSGFTVIDDIESETALALGIAGMAAWLSIQWRGQLKAGESVLILGASGSVGQIAVQVARLLGAATVIGAARSESGRGVVGGLGVDEVIDTEPERLTAAIQEASGGGVDLIIDNLWGEPAAAAMLALNVNGRLVQVGNSASRESTLKAGPIRGTGASILGHRNFQAPLDVQESAFRQLCQYALADEIKIDVEAIPLDDVADAWKRQAGSPGHKLVLKP